MGLESIVNESKLRDFLITGENVDGGDFSSIYNFSSDIILKEYKIIDIECPYPTLDGNLLWEVEVNKYLNNFGFNVPKIIGHFESQIDNENPILIMEKLDALPFQKICDNKFDESIYVFDLFQRKDYLEFSALYYETQDKIKNIGLNLEDSKLFHNTMYRENPKNVFFYDFLGWRPNEKISQFINDNFKNEFPLIYEQSKLNGFIVS